MKTLKTLLLAVFTLLATATFAQGPVEFIENKGQWGDWFAYKAETRGGNICLENDGFRFILADIDNKSRLDSFHHGHLHQSPSLRFHAYKVTFEGGNQHPKMIGKKPQSTYYNYYQGNDPKKWKSGIHPCYVVDYCAVYNNIDLHVASERGNMVYEFMVQPGGDPNKVQLKFDGQDEMYIKKGDLYIVTSVGMVKEMKPYAYQYINDKRVEVACNYVLNNNVLSFEFPDGYEADKLLVIDPTVVFSTLTGSTADNWGYTATYDNNGNFYAGGIVNDVTFGGSFPVSTGAFQATYGGGYGNGSATYGYAYGADISIIKYNPTGTSRLFATYLGGAGNEHPHSMIVDGAGNLIIAGRTLSQNYPITSGCYQSATRGGWDMVVTNMNSTGTALIGSTYIGGTGNDCVNYDSTEYGYGELKYNYGDDSRSEVLVDNANNIYVAGCTMSNNFPTTSTAVSTTLSGIQEAIVFKMSNNCSSLIWSTYLGGNGSDAAYVLAFDSLQQSLYVAGGTNSSNFPTTSGAWRASYSGGGADGFITKFVNGGSYNILKSTYVGTAGYDQVYGIQAHPHNDPYVMGQSVGGTFPVTTGVYSNPNSCQFIMKMDRDLTSDLISTVYGSSNPRSTNISPCAFLVDTCQNVYVAGWGGTLGITAGTTGTCTGMATTTDAFSRSTDGADFYFIVLGSGMTALRYATYFGRNCTSLIHGEHVDGGTSRFDKNGIIYQGICASCGGRPGTSGACGSPFPTTSGAWSEVDSSVNCNQAALKIAFNIGPTDLNITALPSTSGCAPFTVNFDNTSTNVITYRWNFGDGSPVDTNFEPSHTFTASGVYTVTITGSNTNACFRTDDTFELIIVVDTNRINSDFTALVTDSCGPYRASVSNISTAGTSGGAPRSWTIFRWDFGDGSSVVGANPPPHTYADTGNYTIRLIMIDTTACNSPDTSYRLASIHGFDVVASFTLPDSICKGQTIKPGSTIKNGTTITWDFGDGGVGTTDTIEHTFDSVGTFTVRVIVTNPASCNGADTFTRVIKVLDAPISDFSFTPITPETNTPNTFRNLSIDATRYLWDFGDGSTSTEVNPVHQFRRTGTYNVCLTAYNTGGCPAIKCRKLSAEIIPIVGLPTGFSPNGDGDNDILYVRGAAIELMDLKIYNRWGQVVFHSTSQRDGWDGTFNGQPQPIEAYGFVLNVTFIDGSTKLLKGNITIIR